MSSKGMIPGRTQNLSTNVTIKNVLQKRASIKRPPGSKDGPNNMKGIIDILKNPISIMLIFVPAGIACGYFLPEDTPNKAMYTFWVNFVAMVPLANLLGDATEELAANLKNDTLSGLLNATFGNAVEIIMSVAFIFNYQYDVLKASMVGSILSNMLLVLGMAFFFGGLTKQKQKVDELDPKTQRMIPKEVETVKDREQSFNVVGALVNNTLLLIACFMLSLVTVFMLYLDERPGKLIQYKIYELEMSRYTSILIIFAYFAYLCFQLFTHSGLLSDDKPEGEEEDEGEEPALDTKSSCLLMLVVTICVAFTSENLSDSLEAALRATYWTTEFLGVIVIPIIGNACEHASAVRFAIADRAGLAVGIAVGSSVQIALFAIPFTVLAGWIIHPADNDCNMDLNFGMLHVVVLFSSVIIVLSLIMDGKSNWLGGYLLMTAYLIAAGLYFFVREDPEDKEVCGPAP
mmetsp:Transcript_156731/g.285162  ORF Transcript_156731/g.285162 Transcript_156731/m.285162 type:complete len:460 (-) Transcript_156731:92-1471(-)